ncbi:MAG: type II toxin-antitoxin system RelE/ParE family toxin [Methanobacteriaceae archaeon]|nr:type II toxin-antitoxin system RelE/ParE family toxin [Methanobacteriaceae archaeon]
MTYKLLFTTKARKQYIKISKKNKHDGKIIYKKLNEIQENPSNPKYIKVAMTKKYKRVKAGNYRICFNLSDNLDNKIIIVRIEHRRSSYKIHK